LLERREFPVADLGHALKLAVSLRALGLHLQFVDPLRDLLDALELLLLLRPSRRQLVSVGPRLGQFALERVARGGILLRHRRELDLELAHAPLGLVEFERRRVDLHAHARGGLVDEVDRLVRQEAAGDVAIGQHRRGDERGVADADSVMRLVAFLEPAQDRDRVRDRRLPDENGLEAPFERGVLLDVLAVLVECRRADDPQLAAGQHRLEHVGGVDGSLRRAGADDRVQLVDEDDQLALGRLDLLEHGLQALLELATVLRAGEHGADVELPNALALEALGHVAGDDALGEPFDDRRLADAGIADQYRVVLRAAREHLDDAADLLVASDHGIELPRLGGCGQVTAELLERLIRPLGVLARHALRAAHVLEPREQLVAGDDVEREQQVLGRDVLVLELPHLVLGAVEHARERGADLRLLRPSAHDRQPLDLAHRLLLDCASALVEERARQVLAEQCEQQVVGRDLRVAAAARELLGGGDRLLRLERQTVEVHQCSFQ
jgi:hypothetical protein